MQLITHDTIFIVYPSIIHKLANNARHLFRYDEIDRKIIWCSKQMKTYPMKTI